MKSFQSLPAICSVSQLIMTGMMLVLMSCQESSTKTPRPQLTQPKAVTADQQNSTRAVRTTPGEKNLEGSVLYAKYCQSCHGELETSEVTGKDANAVMNAIASVTAMEGLQSLSSAEVNAIVSALGDGVVPGTPPAGSVPADVDNEDEDDEDEDEDESDE